MSINISKSLIVFVAGISLALSACGVECQTCTNGGDPTLQNPGLVCPEEYPSNEDFENFIKQHEVSGGVCD